MQKGFTTAVKLRFIVQSTGVFALQGSKRLRQFSLSQRSQHPRRVLYQILVAKQAIRRKVVVLPKVPGQNKELALQQVVPLAGQRGVEGGI